MLDNIGLHYTAMAANIDEQAIIESLKNQKESARNIADKLAEAKALKISRKQDYCSAGTLVLGSDQILQLEDGSYLSKPRDKEEAARHISILSGKTHRLISAAVMAEEGRPIWRNIDIAKMTMRPLSPNFIEKYVDDNWHEIQYCVGCYQIEGPGALLFAKIEGSQFTIMGMPLLAVIDYLFERKFIA
ncbi:septum formation protein Maf [Sphingorhabdus lutea]|uniref:Nucleoside triphosphate pyrophosphatase n=2 Tax=Sphingorhabdus lutea TaxID=1913578 RepID=A0A1L3JEB9_9SPHN|nr:septum formation protein Maf [Sphingorhabdus lutea]